MPTIRPMVKEEGAAFRVQLDAMLASLRCGDVEAYREMDRDTIELIMRLQAAREVAARIEDTHASLTERKGVRLARPIPLADRT